MPSLVSLVTDDLDQWMIDRPEPTPEDLWHYLMSRFRHHSLNITRDVPYNAAVWAVSGGVFVSEFNDMVDEMYQYIIGYITRLE